MRRAGAIVTTAAVAMLAHHTRSLPTGVGEAAATALPPGTLLLRVDAHRQLFSHSHTCLSKQPPTDDHMASGSAPQSAYDFTVNDGKHVPTDLAGLRGKVTLVMNVASQCGYTQNGYSAATELYEKYKDQGFTVLAFPCNQFGSQEPGTEEQVTEFACTRFKANFPIMEKVEVNGKYASPFWDYIKTAQPGILGTTGIKWNFTVFLVDKQGRVVERLSPGTKVEELEPKIVALLQA